MVAAWTGRACDNREPNIKLFRVPLTMVQLITVSLFWKLSEI